MSNSQQQQSQQHTQAVATEAESIGAFKFMGQMFYLILDMLRTWAMAINTAGKAVNEVCETANVHAQNMTKEAKLEAEEFEVKHNVKLAELRAKLQQAETNNQSTD